MALKEATSDIEEWLASDLKAEKDHTSRLPVEVLHHILSYCVFDHDANWGLREVARVAAANADGSGTTIDRFR